MGTPDGGNQRGGTTRGIEGGKRKKGSKERAIRAASGVGILIFISESCFYFIKSFARIRIISQIICNFVKGINLSE